MRRSPRAAAALIERVESGELTAFDYEADDAMGTTDCDRGCTVEPDGTCAHGYESAALTAGVI